MGLLEHKYTDRDVRENANFYDAAIRYLDQYSGSFDFLIMCKQRLAMEEDLSVGMIRGVMNCMRADPRVTGLPEPGQYSEHEAQVIPMKRPDKKKRGFKYECDRTDLHDAHPSTDTVWSCGGIYAINRDVNTLMKASIHSEYPYFAARGGRLIHTIQPVLTRTEWWPPSRHEFGFATDRFPTLWVGSACVYARGTKCPILLKGDEALGMQLFGERTFCNHCKKYENGEL